MQITEYRNAFDLSVDLAVHRPTEKTFAEWITNYYQGREHSVGAVVLNGKPFSKDDWYNELREEDNIHVMLKPGDPVQIIYGVIAILSVASVVLTPKPNLSKQAPTSPTYNLGSQTNAARLGETVPIHYGRHRIWPDLLAQPFTVYNNNDQYVYQVFCLGAGEFETEQLQIEDTDVSNFSEIDFEYYYNEPVTLFPTNVVTSDETASQELAEAYAGPFVTSAANTLANRLEIDLVWNSGLFRARSDGDTDRAETSILAEYREIDENGDPLGSWQALADETISDATRTPLRITRGVEVTPGRYEVRVSRGEPGQTGPKLFTRCTWEGLRAYLVDDAATYQGLTVLAVRARATGNLNSNSARRFNVVATRKLPIWDGDAWSSSTACRSIAWALADIVLAYYGASRAQTLLDLDKLLLLDAVWEGRGDHFDYRFDTPVTLWEALGVAARAGRAYPIMNNQVISFVRTSAQSIPATIFNRNNTRNMRVEYSLLSEEENDSVIAEYIDPSLGWSLNQVLCQPSGSAGENPKRIKYAGVIDRAQAFREGIYDAEALRRQRKTIKFETELEGYIPNRGDLIAVANEDFKYDQGGEIVAVSGVTLKTSEPLTWNPSLAYSIRLRKPDGSVDGPHLVTEGASANEAVLGAPLSWTPIIGGDQVRTLYQFGVVGSALSEWVVQQINAKSNNIVEVVAVNEVDSVHTVDEAEPPEELYPAPIALNEDGPIVRALLVEKTSNPAVLYVGWSPAPGADSYVLERSLDAGVTWSQWVTTSATHLEMPAPIGLLHLRVAGVGKARGPWKTWVGMVGSYEINSPTDLSLTAELALSSTGDYVTAMVFEFAPPVDDYHVKTFEAQYKLARHVDWKPLYNALESRWEWQLAELGQHQVRVRSVYVQGEIFSDWAETSLTNLGTFASVAQIGLSAPIDPKLFISADFEKATADIRISMGFDPETGARPDRLIMFYSVAEAPNTLVLGSDTGDKLYIDSVGIAGTFTLPCAAGSTTRRVRYTDPTNTTDIDLSGMWWLAIESVSNGTTQYFKVAESSSTELILPQGDELPFVPEDGDTIHIAELEFGDSRLPEFKLLWANGEVIRHSGIKYDGAYYIQVEERGAEGTVQTDQSGQTMHYYPALGPLTTSVEIMTADFVEDEDGTFQYAGAIDLEIPSSIEWASVTCCLARIATEGEGYAYVRSNIVPLVVAGPA